MEYEGRGEAEPVAPNDMPEGGNEADTSGSTLPPWHKDRASNSAESCSQPSSYRMKVDDSTDGRNEEHLHADRHTNLFEAPGC